MEKFISIENKRLKAIATEFGSGRGENVCQPLIGLCSN